MSIKRPSFLIGIFVLFCSLCVVSTTATAGVMYLEIDGEYKPGAWSFDASNGKSQTRTVTVVGVYPSVTVSITGSDAFTVSPSVLVEGEWTFTVTFHPELATTKTSTAVLGVGCEGCEAGADLEGTAPMSDVVSVLPNDVSISVTPNPATDYINVLTHGARNVEIGMYDLLGKEFASRPATDLATEWRLNASSIPPGSYIVLVTGESLTGKAFLTTKRIVISR